MMLWIFFFFLGGGDHYKIGLYLGYISMHFRIFSQCQGTGLGLVKFQIFFWGAKNS